MKIDFQLGSRQKKIETTTNAIATFVCSTVWGMTKERCALIDR